MLRALLILTLVGLAALLGLSLAFAIFFPLALLLLKIGVVVAVLAGLGYLFLRLLDPPRADRYAEQFRREWDRRTSSEPDEAGRDVPVQ